MRISTEQHIQNLKEFLPTLASQKQVAERGGLDEWVKLYGEWIQQVLGDIKYWEDQNEESVDKRGC